MADPFDVAVIGAGPGGYVAAIRAAQLGFRVACIDDWQRADGKPAPGGTCTNVGCIPSKALLQSSENYAHAAHAFADHGIGIQGLSIDVAKMLARKDKVVAQNNDGILYLFKKHKITFLHGRGSFVGGSPNEGWMLKVAGPGATDLVARHVIVATGSTPRPLPGAAIDNELVLDNAGALAIPQVPKRLGVVGAGVIGLEMGSVWRRLGSEVTMLEALPAFLGAVDEAVAKEAHKSFTKQGLVIHTGVNITNVTTGKKRRQGRLDRRRRCGAVGDVRQAHRVDRAHPGDRGLERASRGVAARRARLHRRRRAIAARTCRRSGRSATWCAGRCSRTRPRRRASRSPSASPASIRTSTSTRFRG